MRYLITGGRDFGPVPLIGSIVRAALARRPAATITIVHGDCRGWDQTFAMLAEEAGMRVEPHPAEDHGPWPRCGPLRNSAMVSLGADLCIAGHLSIEHSAGTLDCLNKAIRAGIPSYLWDGCNPARRISFPIERKPSRATKR